MRSVFCDEAAPFEVEIAAQKTPPGNSRNGDCFAESLSLRCAVGQPARKDDGRGFLSGRILPRQDRGPAMTLSEMWVVTRSARSAKRGDSGEPGHGNTGTSQG